ncbi:hypothetical protein P3T24_006585 [Paraburkholderia sp. GAS33]|uniref:hypothetical protein n=1 Tax=Paraburkholderia sp. GAS33 TaxID=3035130 RepID=UPI003D1EBDEB
MQINSQVPAIPTIAFPAQSPTPQGFEDCSGPTFDYCRFVSHSVVRRPDDTLIDITPRPMLRAAAVYPFLNATLGFDQYAELARELYIATVSGDLHWLYADE